MDLTSYQFTWMYAGDVLDIIAVESAGTLSEGMALTVNLDAKSEVRVAAAGTQMLAGSGVLVELVGRVKGDDLFGERIFTPRFEDMLFFDSQAVTTDAETTIGAFSVGGAKVSMGSLDVPAGNAFTLPVQLDALSSPGITSYQFIVRFDPEVIAITTVSEVGSLSESGSVIVNDNNPGQIQVAYAGTTPLLDSGDLIYFNGDRLTDEDPVLELEAVYFFDPTGAAAAVFPAGFEALIPDDAEGTGVLDIPLGIPGIELKAYQFTLMYDPTVLNITGTRMEGTVSNGEEVVSNVTIPGQISVSWAGAEPIEGDGPLLRLDATVLQSGDPGFRYSDYKLVGSPGDGIRVSSVGVVSEDPYLIETISLGPNYPNPFSTQTAIPLQLKHPMTVTLRLYDVIGRDLGTLLHGSSLSGDHVLRFDGTHLPNGIYMLVLEADGTSHRRLMTVAR